MTKLITKTSRKIFNNRKKTKVQLFKEATNKLDDIKKRSDNLETKIHLQQSAMQQQSQELKRIGIQKRRFQPRLKGGASQTNTDGSEKASKNDQRTEQSPNQSLNLSKQDLKSEKNIEVLRESKSQPEPKAGNLKVKVTEPGEKKIEKLSPDFKQAVQKIRFRIPQDAEQNLAKNGAWGSQGTIEIRQKLDESKESTSQSQQHNFVQKIQRFDYATAANEKVSAQLNIKSERILRKNGFQSSSSSSSSKFKSMQNTEIDTSKILDQKTSEDPETQKKNTILGLQFSPILERIDEIDLNHRGIENPEEFENSQSSGRNLVRMELDMTYNFQNEFNPIRLLQDTDTLLNHRSFFRPSLKKGSQIATAIRLNHEELAKSPQKMFESSDQLHLKKSSLPRISMTKSQSKVTAFGISKTSLREVENRSQDLFKSIDGFFESTVEENTTGSHFRVGQSKNLPKLSQTTSVINSGKDKKTKIMQKMSKFEMGLPNNHLMSDSIMQDIKSIKKSYEVIEQSNILVKDEALKTAQLFHPVKKNYEQSRSVQNMLQNRSKKCIFMLLNEEQAGSKLIAKISKTGKPLMIRYDNTQLNHLSQETYNFFRRSPLLIKVNFFKKSLQKLSQIIE